jgi:hypothetical protein
MRVKRRAFASLKSLEEIDEPEDPKNVEDVIHGEIALRQLSLLILRLKPLDRQVILLATVLLLKKQVSTLHIFQRLEH